MGHYSLDTQYHIPAFKKNALDVDEFIKLLEEFFLSFLSFRVITTCPCDMIFFYLDMILYSI